MKNLTWQNPEQLFVAQELIKKVKLKCCGIKGIYNFENEPFGDIAKRLELYYDINIIVSDTSLEAREYTGKFRQLDGVDEILRIIQKIHKFKIKKEPEKNTIIISR